MVTRPGAPNPALPYAVVEEGEGLDDLVWDDFRVFVTVVRAGSFNRAAQILGTTQPTVSRRLARLEGAIGVRLFDRDKTGPTLTYEGQRIFNDASAAELSVMRAARKAKATARRVEGDCKLTMGDGLAAYWLPRFLPMFFARHPGVELKLFAAQDVAGDKKEIFDLHVHYYQPAQTDPVAVRLGTLHFMPFASRSYLDAFGMPRTVADLGNHRLLDFAQYLVGKGSWAAWSNEEAARQTALFTNASVVLGEAIKAGVGIGLLPTYGAAAEPDLVPLDLGLTFQAPVFVSFQRDATKKWPVRVTLDFLRSTVFDRRRMPWFADEFVVPERDWRSRLDSCISQYAAVAA